MHVVSVPVGNRLTFIETSGNARGVSAAPSHPERGRAQRAAWSLRRWAIRMRKVRRVSRTSASERTENRHLWVDLGESQVGFLDRSAGQNSGSAGLY